MGAYSDLAALLERGPAPDEGDVWVLAMARVIAAKHARKVARVTMPAPIMHTTQDDEVLYV